MGQVLSMIWRWVIPKSQAVSKPDDGDDGMPDDQLIIPLTQNEQPGIKESHCINIFHPDQLFSDPISTIEVDGDDYNHSAANLIPTLPSDSAVILSNNIYVSVGEEDDDNVEPMEVKNDQVLKVVVEEKAEINIAKNTKNNEIYNGISVCCSLKSKLARRNRIGPYSSTQRILLVGEGDFSFSACLAVAFGSASNMVATSLNSLEFVIKNYGNFCTNLSELETRGSVVLHGVDATKMAKHPCLSQVKFDRIIYNFPHAGFKRESFESQIRRHQKLVRGFLKNAKKMTEEDGEIHVTHKTSPSFLKWDIPKLGSDQGLCLIQAVKFKLRKYPGYHTKYGFGGDKDFDCNPSKTYKFGLTSKEKLITP